MPWKRLKARLKFDSMVYPTLELTLLAEAPSWSSLRAIRILAASCHWVTESPVSCWNAARTSAAKSLWAASADVPSV